LALFIDIANCLSNASSFTLFTLSRYEF